MQPRGYGRICRHGHKVVGDDMFVTPKGYAGCRACARARWRVPVEPGEGVECLICGDYMRTLGPHLRDIHKMTGKEYRRQYPGAPVSGFIFRAIRMDHFLDQRAAGERAKWEKQGLCSRGLHQMRGKNVRVDPRGGRHGRQCRACYEQAKSEWRKRNRKKVLKSARAYRRRNRKEIRQYHAEWRSRNKDRIHQYYVNRKKKENA